MILPTNGKVIIFDDKYEDVEGLLKTLSKKKIPYNYYQDESGEDLPDSPIRNVRLVFLDLQLISGQSVPSHTIISTIGGRLQRVIEPNNSYILIYWSTKESKYKKAIDNAFENGLADYKPAITVSLNKSEAIKKGNGIVDYIIEAIEEKSKDFSLFKIFALWENLVNDSAGNLINNFTEFIGKDELWDDSAKHVLYKLSQAYSGKTTKKKDDIEQLQDSFLTLNQALLDSIENRITEALEKNKEIVKNVVVERENDKEEYTSIINNKLLLSEMNLKGEIPGSMFLLDDEIEIKKSVCQEKVEKIKLARIPEGKKEGILQAGIKKCEKEIIVIDHQFDVVIKNFKLLINSIIRMDESPQKDDLRKKLLTESIKIELNVSPLCDYAQEKMPCVRLLPGLLLKKEHKNLVFAQNPYNYISDGFIKFGDEDYYFLFDFRFLYSKSSSVLKNRSSNYKLRHQLLSDIQLKLGNHISRSGVIYIQ